MEAGNVDDEIKFQSVSYLKSRVEELEEQIKRMRRPANSSSNSSSSNISNNQTTIEQVKRSSPNLNSLSRGPLRPRRSSQTYLHRLPNGKSATNAPLIGFLSSSTFQTDLSETQDEEMLEGDWQNEDMISNLLSILPTSEALHSILVATEEYWILWPSFYVGPNESDQVKAGNVLSSVTRILSILDSSSSSPSSIAKAVLFITLCLQQMEPGWIQTRTQSATPSKSLIKTYLSIVQNIIMVQIQDLIPSLATIECILLQYKLLINMGKARKAWFSLRNGMNMALLLGLQHSDARTTDRENDLWNQLYKGELLLCLVLGFPIMTSAPHRKLTESKTRHGVKGPLSQMFSIIATLVERNQRTDLIDDYDATMQLDRDWQQCRASIPDEWWTSSTPDDSKNNIGFIHKREQTKLLCSLIGKYIHLPYLFKSRLDDKGNNSKFIYSRLSVLQTSKDLIKAYISLRNNSKTRLIMCEIMDFQSFSAGMTIVIEQLSRPSQIMDDNDEELLRHVETLASTLLRTSIDLECNVAAQGSQLLQNFCALRRGIGGVLVNGFEAVIPYFGRVRIQPHQYSQSVEGSNDKDSLSQDSYSSVYPSSSVVTSISTLIPTSAADEGYFDLTADLFSTPIFGQGFNIGSDINSDWPTNFHYQQSD